MTSIKNHRLFSSRIQKDNGIDLSQDKMALQRLKDAAEKRKRSFWRNKHTNLLTFYHSWRSWSTSLKVTLTRAKFDELTHDLVERTIAPTRQALKDANLSASDIDQVILVGGSTRIPAVQETIKKN